MLADRRGATALVFAGAAFGRFGFAALATEGGLWYYTQRDARSATDMAAMGGASSYLYKPGDHSAARAAATDAASRNDFRADARTSILVNAPAAHGEKSVEVVITRRIPTFLSGLLIGEPEVSVVTRAVALVDNGNMRACILATHSGLTLRGSTSISAPTCVLHSNRMGANSTWRQGQSMVLDVGGLTATGQCVSCDYTGNGSTVRAYGSARPPVPDPFDWANSVPMPPSLSGSACSQTSLKDWPRLNNGTLREVRPPAGTQRMIFCGDQSLEGQQGGGVGTWDFAPGTYYFTGNFSVKTAILTCSTCVPGESGVTIVMVGANGAAPGVLSFTAQSVVRLNAPPTGRGYPYPGLLIYRDDAGSPAPAQISLAGGGASSLVGGIYGPTSGIYYAGNNDTVGVNRNCFVLVADGVDVAGGSGSVQHNDCDTVGTNVPRLQVVRLVE
ncbi:MAG: Tad domain-containing protein [Acetobacteraceae bacterium]|nr:Tad domain-containing protein [Acetobacteraceae bacterium]